MERAGDPSRGSCPENHETEFCIGRRRLGLLVADHAVRHHRPGPRLPDDDKAVLEHLMANVGAAAFAPVVVGAAPALLDVESFAELGPIADPAACLADPDHARWRGLRDRLDSRFLAGSPAGPGDPALAGRRHARRRLPLSRAGGGGHRPSVG